MVSFTGLLRMASAKLEASGNLARGVLASASVCYPAVNVRSAPVLPALPAELTLQWVTRTAAVAVRGLDLRGPLAQVVRAQS